MFSRILVALDRSAMADCVFQTALSLAHPASSMAQASCLLVHVLSGEEVGTPPYIPLSHGAGYAYPLMNSEWTADSRQQWDAVKQSSLHQLQARSQQARQAGILADWAQPAGPTGLTLCNLARSWEADTIVIGRRGLYGLQEFLMGSVSNYVVHHAPCAVMVVNPPPASTMSSDCDSSDSLIDSGKSIDSPASRVEPVIAEAAENVDVSQPHLPVR